MQRRIYLTAAIVLIGCLAWSGAGAALAQPAAPPVPAASPRAAALVIDHTMTDLDLIPDAWLAQAKLFQFHLAHTSHGSQILTGLEWWENQNPKYDVDIRYDVAGRAPAAALRIYDGNDYAGDNYIVPEMYWSESDGRDHTLSVAGTGLFKYSAWTWCGQQSGNDVDTVNLYLTTLDQFEQAYPDMRFIYFTGHTDGGSETLAANNAMVRTYVTQHDKVLFDFADFERYDPAGGYHPTADDSCPWCDQWYTDHPADCANLDQIGDCAHTHPLQCKLKAAAFWWLLARLAGWNGGAEPTDFVYLPLTARPVAQ